MHFNDHLKHVSFFSNFFSDMYNPYVLSNTIVEYSVVSDLCNMAIPTSIQNYVKPPDKFLSNGDLLSLWTHEPVKFQETLAKGLFIGRISGHYTIRRSGHCKRGVWSLTP